MNVGKIVVILIGLGMTLLGTFGTVNAITRWGEKPAEKIDMDAKGRITHLEVTELTHAIGWHAQ